MSIQFTARPTPSRRPLVLTVALVAFFTLWHTFGAMFGATADTTGRVSGVVFHDGDRDAVQGDGEEPMYIALAVYDGSGTRLDAKYNDPDTGEYTFTGLPAEELTVKIHPVVWDDYELDWVPTTNDGLYPEVAVDLSASTSATVDFGLRRIVRSTDVGAPLSSATTAEGIQVHSYNDAVDAQEIAATLALGSLFGGEAPLTVLRFDISTGDWCATGVAGGPGSYSDFSAECWITYGPWLSSFDRNLFHEYAHSWSQHAKWIVQQTDTYEAYLEARGLLGDDRIGSSAKWTAGEMIAEDYRQLFGSSTAVAWPQSNQDIPPASEVPGLKEFLLNFGGESTSDAGTTDTTEPTVSDLAPSQDTTVSGPVTATVSVSDDTSEVEGLDVSILLDGVAHTAAYDSSTDTWQAVVDTTAVPDGTVMLEGRATDGAGNTASVSHEVAVDNSDDSSASTTEDSTGPTISSIESGSVNSGSAWTAWMDVTVTDGGVPVAGVVVEASWTGAGKHGGSGTVNCTTGAQGLCRLSIDQPKRVDGVTFETVSPSVVTVSVLKP